MEDKTEMKQEFDIEYFAIRVEAINDGSKLELAKELQTISANDITYLDIDGIQSIVEFKWRKYTRGYFMHRF